MFDFGLSEILLIAVVAILFIGPKELPVVMAQVGRVFRRLNYMRHAVMMQFDDFMRDSGMDDIRNDVNFEASVQERSPVDAHGDAIAMIEKPPIVEALPKAEAGAAAKSKKVRGQAKLKTKGASQPSKSSSGRKKPSANKASAKKASAKKASAKKPAKKVTSDE